MQLHHCLRALSSSARRERWSRWRMALLGRWAGLALALGCAHVEADAPATPGSPGAPGAPGAPEAAPSGAAPSAPETTLRVSTAPIEALRSPYFSALQVTFENPSSEWHEVRRVSITSERQLFGPALESLVGERLRAWQLAAREAHAGKEGPQHPVLETLAPNAPVKADGDAAAPVVPPNYLLACPFTVAPGLFTRKWIALYSTAPDALLGQDLVLSYELDGGQVERVLIQYPKPAPPP